MPTHDLSVVQAGSNVGADAGDPSWTGVNGDPGTGVATIDTASPAGAHTVVVFLQADASAYPVDTIDHIDMVATATASGPGTGLEVSFDSTNAIVPVGTLYTQQLILENDLQNWPLVQPTLTVFIETTGVGEVVLTVTEVHLVVTLVAVAPPPLDVVEPAFTPPMGGGGWVSPVRWGTPYNPPPLSYTRPRETPRVTWQDDLMAALVARLERDLNRELRRETRAVEQAKQLRAARIRAEDDLLILLL